MGKMTFPNGDVYNGQWQNDKKTGQGLSLGTHKLQCSDAWAPLAPGRPGPDVYTSTSYVSSSHRAQIEPALAYKERGSMEMEAERV